MYVRAEVINYTVGYLFLRVIMTFKVFVLAIGLQVLLATVSAACTCSLNQVNRSGETEPTTEARPQYYNCTVCEECDCQSLEEVASIVVTNTSVYIEISSDLTISEIVTFRELKSLKITGKTNHVIVCSSTNAGLVLKSIDTVSIHNIALRYCGVIYNHPVHSLRSGNSVNFSAALNILWCANVSVSETEITNSKGTGLLLLHTEEGVVNVSNSQFKENALPESDPVFSGVEGGGGILLRTINTTHTAYFNIINCTFECNTAQNTQVFKFIFTDQFGTPLSGSGRGGGMLVLVDNFAENKHIWISNCTFINNQAYLGAGLSLYVEDGAQHNSIFVRDSLFKENGCNEKHKTGGGGGVLFSYDSYNFSMPSNNTIHVHNSTFLKNCALLGGGTYFFTQRSQYRDFSNTINFTNCTWSENFAHVGSAVDFTPHIFDRFSNGFLPTPTFEDCKFFNNTVSIESHHTQTAHGEGTLYSSLFNIHFLSSVHFENNSGSAVVIVNGVASFSNANATFISNSAIQGGAIALIGLSSITFGPNHSYLFENNTATDRGGAIYSELLDKHDLIVSRSCFIRHEENLTINIPEPLRNTNILFRGNRAIGNELGNAIFTTSLIPCQVISNGNDYIILKNTSKIFEQFGMILEEREPRQTISTDVARFVHGATPFHIIPGEEYQLDVQVMDDLNQIVNTALQASIIVNSNRDSKIQVDAAFAYISKTIRVQGTPGQQGTLILQTVTLRRSSLALEVVLAPCPPGFELQNKQCVCVAHTYLGLTMCNETHMNSVLAQGFWVGLINVDNTTHLATSICPLNFCEYQQIDSMTEEVKLPRDPSQLEDTICGPRRSGVLCSNCKPNYTVHFHSPNFECKEITETLCKVGWLFYLLSELVSVTILFVVILAFHISFTSGAVNGFILFTQLLDTMMIDANGVIELTESIKVLTQVQQVIYGFFNLEFFNINSLSFCIWRNATVLDVIAFKYVTVAYALFLTTVVIVFIQKCGARCLGQHFSITNLKSSVIHGISSFLVVCYSQCIKTSLRLLFNHHLLFRGAHSLTRRVWFRGDIEPFSQEHLVYAIPALLCLLIIGIPPPLLLLAYPLTNKILAKCGVEESKFVRFFSRMIPVNKLKPLFDSFQGIFRDNFRFFAGLYFLYRWTALVLYVSSLTYSAFYSLLGLLFVCIVALHAICQPYVKKWHNLLDTVLFTNMVIINIITMIHYYGSRVAAGNTDYIKVTGWIQLLLIYIPLMYMAAYTTVKICQKSSSIPESKAKVRRRISSIVESFKLMRRESQKEEEEELPYRMIVGEEVEYEKHYNTGNTCKEN